MCNVLFGFTIVGFLFVFMNYTCKTGKPLFGASEMSILIFIPNSYDAESTAALLNHIRPFSTLVAKLTCRHFHFPFNSENLHLSPPPLTIHFTRSVNGVPSNYMTKTLLEIETGVRRLLLAAPQSGAKFVAAKEPTATTQSRWLTLSLESILGSGL